MRQKIIWIALGIIIVIMVVIMTINRNRQYQMKETPYQEAIELTLAGDYKNALSRAVACENVDYDYEYKDLEALIHLLHAKYKMEDRDYELADYHLMRASFSYDHAEELNAMVENMRAICQPHIDAEKAQRQREEASKNSQPTPATSPPGRPAVTDRTTAVPSDTYHAKDYENAEEFFEDNYYDFFDFDDAEDYWEENGED